MKLLKNLDAKIINGECATGCNSHTKNKIKYYVVAYKNKLHYGTDLETIFNTL
jgi:hypothetical protein